MLACGIKNLSPLCMIFADDIALCSTRREDVEKKLRQEAEYHDKGNCTSGSSELGLELIYQSTRRLF